MQANRDTCQGQWNVHRTEIPDYQATQEGLSLSPSGDAAWSVEHGFKQVCETKLQWTLDEEGCILLVSNTGSVISRCDVDVNGDLMTLTPAHGFSSVFERVAARALFPKS